MTAIDTQICLVPKFFPEWYDTCFANMFLEVKSLHSQARYRCLKRRKGGAQLGRYMSNYHWHR